MITPNEIAVKRQEKILDFIEKGIIKNFKGLDIDVSIDWTSCPVNVFEEDELWLTRKLGASGWEIIEYAPILILKAKKMGKDTNSNIYTHKAIYFRE